MIIFKGKKILQKSKILIFSEKDGHKTSETNMNYFLSGTGVKTWL